MLMLNLRAMRIAIAKYGQETSSFSPVPTTLDTFRIYGLSEGQQVLEAVPASGSLAGFLQAAAATGEAWAPLPIISGWAGASGKITPPTLAYFDEKIQAGLRAAGPIEGFYFDLHGAGEAENEPDTEGYLLERCRQLLGPTVPIVIALDHHANLTQRMVDNCDALVAHRSQPHQPYETGQLAAQILFSILQGKIQPTMAWRKIPLITHQEQFLTTIDGPMREWFELAREMESRPHVVSVSTFPMQPWLDVPEGGWAVSVLTNDEPSLADSLAAELAAAAWSRRDRFLVQQSVAPAEAVQRAMAADSGVVILSDTGDSVFGGSTGDSTCLLRELIRQDVDQLSLVPLVDPEAVECAIQAGLDAVITIDVGGKLDSHFHQPVEVRARVAGIGGGRIEADVIGMSSFDMGRAVLLEVGAIRIAVSENRGVGGNHPAVYRHFDLEPADAKLVVLKTASNWQYYQEMTSEVIRVDTPGPTMSDLAGFDWQHLPRPIYPLDEI
jgi:microcystin degradation protein MlrC